MSYHFVYFICNLLNFSAAVFLCFYAVQDRIEPPLWRVALPSGLAVVAFLAPISTLPFYLQSFLTLFFLVGAFLFYRKTVKLNDSKLLFVLFCVANYCAFVTTTFSAFKPEVNEQRIIANLVTLVLTLPPMTLVLRRLLHPTIIILDDQTWRYLWLLPFFFTVVIVLFNEIMVGVARPLHIFLRFVLAIYTATIYLQILFFLRRAVQRTQDQERAQAAEQFLSLQSEQYQSLLDYIQQVKILNHDMRHQLVVLREQAVNGDHLKSIAYCDALLERLPQLKERLLCENFTVSAVVSYYASLAEAASLSTQIELDVPAQAGLIEDMDLCIVIGNLLENAINACKQLSPEKRRLQMRAQVRQNNLIISIINSCPVFERPFGRPDWSIGLRSVHAVSEKYHGYARFESQQGQFHSSVLLQLQPEWPQPQRVIEITEAETAEMPSPKAPAGEAQAVASSFRNCQSLSDDR